MGDYTRPVFYYWSGSLVENMFPESTASQV